MARKGCFRPPRKYMTTRNRKPLCEVAHNLRVAVQELYVKPRAGHHPPRAFVHALAPCHSELLGV